MSESHEWSDILFPTIMRLGRMLRSSRFSSLGRTTYPFTDFFKGYEKTTAVRRIFGESTEQVLGSLRVEFNPIVGYMGVDGADGHLMISSKYLKEGDKVDIHLDIVHELVHVRQFHEGKELWDSRYSYVERPTEIEAYRYAVDEARKLGLDDERICNYLKTEWMTKQDLRKLAKTLNVVCSDWLARVNN